MHGSPKPDGLHMADLTSMCIALRLVVLTPVCAFSVECDAVTTQDAAQAFREKREGCKLPDLSKGMVDAPDGEHGVEIRRFTLLGINPRKKELFHAFESLHQDMSVESGVEEE